MHAVVLLVAAALSLAGFGLMALDKRAARRGAGRIAEARFATLAALGAWPGILAAMATLRHKTRSLGFQAKLALGALVHLAVAWLLWPLEP